LFLLKLGRLATTGSWKPAATGTLVAANSLQAIMVQLRASVCLLAEERSKLILL
jgi:hypothetical protein